MASNDYKNWSRCEPDEASANVSQIILDAESQTSWRHLMAARGAAVYESINRGSIFQSLQYHECQRRESANKYRSWQVGKSIVNTIVAKVMGLDNPKCQMVTTDATWEEKRDAIWADRFIEGNSHEEQGNFANLWDLGRAGATMAFAATGMAGIRTEPDFVFKRVSHSLRSTLSTFIDPSDYHHGRPLSYFDVTYENPEVLAEDPRWPEHKDHIMASAADLPTWMRRDGELNLGTPLVRVVTAWRLPFGSFKGREARFVGNKAIQWDDYEHNHPRIAFFRAGRLLGDSFHSENLLESISEPLRTGNKTVQRTQEALDKLSDVMVAVDTESIPEKAVGSAETVKFIKWSSKRGGQAPQVITIPIVDQSRQQFADRNFQMAHQIVGVDEMHTAGRRPEGMTSGRGVRMVASLFSERYSEVQRGWRNWIAVDVPKNTIIAAVEIGEHVPDWQTTWEGEDFDAKVSVAAIAKIADRKYSTRAYVVAEQKNTPGDRAEMANEMLANGQISPESHAEIVSTTFDTPSETKVESSQRRFFAKLIDLALHAEQSDIEDPDFWAQEYQSPPPWADAPTAMRQVFGAYWEALIDDVPQYRREVLKRCLEELDFMVQQAAQQQAAAEGLRVNVDADTVGAAMGGQPAPETQGPPNAEPPGGLAPGDGLTIQ